MASDGYTPTTAEVRSDYHPVSWANYEPERDPNADADFDRWLADERAKAWDEGYEGRQAEEDSEYVQYGSVFRDSAENPYR